MKTQISNLVAQCGLIVVVNAIFGYLIYFMPPLQHWFVFVLWAVVPAVLLIRMGSHYRESVLDTLWKWDILRGLPLGITHFITAILIWVVVTRLL
jgi:hypothetical protein